LVHELQNFKPLGASFGGRFSKGLLKKVKKKQFIIYFFKTLKALRHIGPAALVADYRALWLQLSKITRHTGTSVCYTFTFIILYLFFVITLSVYGLMSQVSEGFGVKDIGLAITAFSNVFLLFFVCDEGHNAAFNLKTIFQKKILMVELSW
jgi:gustatory receptor